MLQREGISGMADYDLAIVGGGINGIGIARDAAGRGLRVLLVEQNDLASGTSSASTKLIHGGLRYLEHGWFHLVREALAEREVMLRMAPHLVHPLRFVLPVEPGMRSRALIRFGLFIYDHLGGRGILPGTRSIDLARDPLGAPLKGRYERAFEYSDCQTDDARLAVVSALDASERGAVIRTRTRCLRADRAEDWRIVLDVRGRRDITTARVLVNATGPWLACFAEQALAVPSLAHLRLDKGSHIVVRRLFDHDRGYIFQTRDGRVVFALPFEDDFTLVGTTDRGFSGDPTGIAPDAEEIDYLCGVVNDHFRMRLSATDVIWSFAGVRALYDDGSGKPQDAPRDYVLTLDAPSGLAPLLTVYGGKITTYRRLAEAALEKLAPILGARPPWTARSRLPGGEFESFDRLIAEIHGQWPFLTAAHAHRLARGYGARAARMLGAAQSYGDLGPSLGADLTGAEVHYLMTQEWAQTADDVLWRRSKLGLRVTREERARLANFMVGAIGADM